MPNECSKIEILFLVVLFFVFSFSFCFPTQFNERVRDKSIDIHLQVMLLKLNEGKQIGTKNMFCSKN